jgi:hypothetical protein
MIRLGLLILAVFYLALPAMAQSIQVRSGEHADFSRLTLNLPERIGWSVVPSERGAHVLLGSNALTIDPGVIFDRIPRDRLTDAQWNAERRRLELTFGCDCAVRGFWFGKSMLVLDISARDPDRADEPDLTGQRLVSHAPEPVPSRATNLLTTFVAAAPWPWPGRRRVPLACDAPPRWPPPARSSWRQWWPSGPPRCPPRGSWWPA